MSRVPRIRFKGFEEDWEQRKLGEIFIYLRNNTLSREELNDEYGVAQSIHYGDVLIKYGECLNVSNELLPFINQQYIVDKFKKCYIQNGDIIIADTAEDETVGKCTEISGIVNQNIISGLHTIPLRPVNKFANGYLGFYLNSNSYHKQLKPLMQGIKVISISKNSLKTTVLEYPSEINEQQKIGTCFQSLDHLITLHQRKLKKLKNIKKSMLENLFPKNGEKTPRIRFSGFTEDWEQRKLGEVVEIYDGVHQTPNYTDNGIMFLSVENITKLKSSKFISEEAFKRDYKFYPQENDILMTRIGDVGTTNVVTDNSLKAYYVSLALLKYKSTNPFFLSSAIQSDFVQSGLANRTLKTAIPIKINKDEIGKVNVMLPLLKDEQELIGYCFHNLDHLITLHQSKLEKLRKIKKSMLESMFV